MNSQILEKIQGKKRSLELILRNMTPIGTTQSQEPHSCLEAKSRRMERLLLVLGKPWLPKFKWISKI